MKKPARKTVEVFESADTSRLYGSLPDAIAYLQEVMAAHPGIDISLTERWNGYEDMQMSFTYSRPQTDEEYEAMVKRAETILAEQKQAAEEAVQKAERLEQYRRLKREFG